MSALSEADIEVTDIGDFPNHEPTFQDPYNAAGNINTANSYSYDALGNLTKDATEQHPRRIRNRHFDVSKWGNFEVRANLR